MALTRDEAVRFVEASNGIIRLLPAWVARDWIRSGRRLGLEDHEYELGERGEICERWLASTTPAANRVRHPGEGISSVEFQGRRVQLDELVSAAPDIIMGEQYARTHEGLGRLAKIFDFEERVPYHVHPTEEQASKVGLHSKDEAYYFLPGPDPGKHPESFFGMHSSLPVGVAKDRLLEYLRAWEGEAVLELSKAYRQFPEGGYFVPSGVLHSPGTALTFELQEDSDAMAFLQGTCGGIELSKDLLVGPLDEEQVKSRGEEAVLDWIEWDINQEEDFHSRWHLAPRTISDDDGVEISWLLYGSDKFSAKRIRMESGSTFNLKEPGVFSLFVWDGQVSIGGHDFSAGEPEKDEAIITHNRAVGGLQAINTGETNNELIIFFGPDIHPGITAGSEYQK